MSEAGGICYSYAMKTILVTASTKAELSLLIRSLGASAASLSLQYETFSGKLGDTAITFGITGIGKCNAASAMTAMLEKLQPELVINTGCAGAYPGSGLAVGDLAVAISEIYGDEGVLTPSGWQPMELIGIPLLEKKQQRYFNEFPLSLAAAEQAVHLAEAHGIRMARGKFITVSTCSGTRKRGLELEQRFGAICENMEGAAVAHVSLLYGADCLELRGISNMTEDRDMSAWDIPLAVEQAQRFVLKYLENLC